METGIAAIITSAAGALTDLGVLPYVFAGAVFAVVGRMILAARKAAR